MSTHIRVPDEIKRKLDNLSKPGESVGSIIARLISYYETAGSVNNEVNTPVNSSQIDLEALVNSIVNDKLTDLQTQVNSIVNSQLTQINERLEALEARPGHSVGDKPDDKPEKNIRGDEHDQGDKIKVEGDVRTQIRMKIVDSGITIKQISDLTGINESAIKKLKSEKNRDTVNLKPHQIEALMNLSPVQKSSSEAL